MTSHSFVRILMLLAGTAFGTSALADGGFANAWTGGIGGASGRYDDDADRTGGIALTVSWQGKYSHLFATLTPLDVTFVPGEEDDRYYEDEFSNGQSRCRDSETGQFADDEKCNGDVQIEYAAAGEIGAMFDADSHPWFLGGGYRAGFGDGAYGVVSFSFQPLSQTHYFVKAVVGADFVQATLNASFGL